MIAPFVSAQIDIRRVEVQFAQGTSAARVSGPIKGDDPALSQGYRGHDEFAVVENALAHRFPIYRDGDVDSKATGGMRQMQYKLVPGEAGWILKLQQTTQW